MANSHRSSTPAALAGKAAHGLYTAGWLTGLAATLLLTPALHRNAGAQTAPAPASLPGESVDQATAVALENAFTRVAALVGPATVSITARPPEKPRSSREERGRKDEDLFDQFFGEVPESRRSSPRATGSGVIVRADGYILTNDHIVEDAQGGELEVTLWDGSVYKGKAFRDPGSDLAVIKINPEKPLPVIQLADSSRIQVGQWAIAIGSPFGQQNTMTTGIVSALHRRKSIRDGGFSRLYPDLIQTDASINPGNSGGPLLNIRGELIGINVAIFSPSGVSAGIGYAIPANTVKRVMEQLILNGKVTSGWLGLIPTNIPAGLRQRLGVSQGAYITQVDSGTPAQRAGIQPDDVVIRVGNTAVTGEGEFREAIASLQPGTQVSLKVVRRGKTLDLTARLGVPPASPVPDSPAPTATASAPRTPQTLGFGPRSLAGASGTRPTAPVGVSGVSGVLVSWVRPGSLADEAGLTSNSVITHVNQVAVSSVEGVNKALQALPPGATVTLFIVRQNGSVRQSEAVVNILLP